MLPGDDCVLVLALLLVSTFISFIGLNFVADKHALLYARQVHLMHGACIWFACKAYNMHTEGILIFLCLFGSGMATIKPPEQT